MNSWCKIPHATLKYKAIAMKNNHCFVFTIHLLFAFAFFILQEQPSIACENLKEPEVRRIQVAGAGEFAAQVDPYIRMPGKKAIIFDLHGVLTRYSEPPHHECQPRGDMVDFLKFVALTQDPNLEVIVASAWDEFSETVTQAKFLGLTEVLKMYGDIIEGEYRNEDVVYEYVRLGNLISVREQKKKEESCILNSTKKPQREFYLYKAFSLLVAYGADCAFDVVVFIDDSKGNVDRFSTSVKRTPYYSKLKMLVLFDIPTIKGEFNLIDQIPKDLLPVEYRSLSKIETRKSDVLEDELTFEDALASRPVPSLILPVRIFKNPLAKTGFYPVGDLESDGEQDASQAVASSAAASFTSSRHPPLLSSTVVDLSEASDQSRLTQIHLSRSAEICRMEEPSMLQNQHTGGRDHLTKSH